MQTTVGEFRHRLNDAEIAYMIERNKTKQTIKYNSWLRLHKHWIDKVIKPHNEDVFTRIAKEAHRFNTSGDSVPARSLKRYKVYHNYS